MARHELRLRVGANKPFIGPVYSTDTGVWRHSAVIHLTFLLLVFISFGISLFPTRRSSTKLYKNGFVRESFVERLESVYVYALEDRLMEPSSR